MFAGLVAKGIALFTVPILTRSLGAGGYALVDLATSTAYMLVVISTLAGDLPTARRAAHVPPAERPRVFGNYVSAVAIAGTAIMVVLIPASGFIAGSFWSSPDAEFIALLAVVLVPVSAVQTAFATILRIRRRPRQFAVVQTIDLVAQMLAASALVLIGFGPEGAVVGLLAGSTVGLVAAFVATRDTVTITFAPSRWGEVAVGGAPYLPAALSFVIADVVARSQLAESHGASSVGPLGLAVRLAGVVALAMSAFQLAWGPTAMTRSADERTTEVFGRALVGISVVAASASIAWSCLSPEVIRLLSGPEFDAAATAIPGLALSSVITAATFILITHAGISGRSHHVAIASVLGGSVQVLFTAVLVGPLALLGVGIGALIGRGTGFVLLVWSTWRALGNALFTCVAALLLAACASVFVAVLALQPAAETLPLRILIAIVASLIGAAVVRGLLATAEPPRIREPRS